VGPAIEAAGKRPAVPRCAFASPRGRVLPPGRGLLYPMTFSSSGLKNRGAAPDPETGERGEHRPARRRRRYRSPILAPSFDTEWPTSGGAQLRCARDNGLARGAGWEGWPPNRRCRQACGDSLSGARPEPGGWLRWHSTDNAAMIGVGGDPALLQLASAVSTALGVGWRDCPGARRSPLWFQRAEFSFPLSEGALPVGPMAYS